MSRYNIIRPQEGYQMKALSSSADIVIGGGSAGVGKTFSLLLEPLRHVKNPKFRTTIFRRTMPQIKASGGLWDASVSMYSSINNSKAREHTSEWIFDSGAKVKFAHLQYEKDVLNYQGSEIDLIGFDELTHFSKNMFFYMLSRNRSTSGVKPYIRTTCNPDPDSWVAEFIDWWIDIDGFPIPEREGELRYFFKKGEKYLFGNNQGEVYEQAKESIDEQIEKSKGLLKKQDYIKSLTFISGSIYQNVELLTKDPSYLANLNAQSEDKRRQLLDGNWKVSVKKEDLFKYNEFCASFNANYSVRTGVKYITADIAMQGSDKFVVCVWDGWEIIDVQIMNKSNGRQVLDLILAMASKYKVSQSKIVWDNDGVGTFLDGFIEFGFGFKNGSSAIGRENYANLKTQCYYKAGEKINEGKFVVSDFVSNKMYDDENTIRQKMIHQRKAIKKLDTDIGQKLKIIPKNEMKEIIGESPDLMDVICMRAVFDLGQKV